MHNHNHGHVSGTKIRDIIVTLSLNLLITLAELVGGIIAGSLSLISDAMHNLSDAASLAVSLVALQVSQHPPDKKRTFGYKRIGVLAAVWNASVLAIICLGLFREAYLRLISPRAVNGATVVLVGSVGLIANTLGAYLLRRHSAEDLNVRSSYLHLASDALSSVAVIMGGIGIYFYKAFWVDPVLTFVISAYVFKETVEVIREALNILLEGKPTDIDTQELAQTFISMPQVNGVHHIHVWTLDGTSTLLEAHVQVNEDMPVSQTQEITRELEKRLHERFGIEHVVLQFENRPCEETCPFAEPQIHHGGAHRSPDANQT